MYSLHYMKTFISQGFALKPNRGKPLYPDMLFGVYVAMNWLDLLKFLTEQDSIQNSQNTQAQITELYSWLSTLTRASLRTTLLFGFIVIIDTVILCYHFAKTNRRLNKLEKILTSDNSRSET